MLSVLLLLLQSSGAPQSVYDARLRHIAVHLPRIEDAAVRLDGVLDEPVWRRAALLKGFTQYRPVDSRPAEDSTEVFVFYAPDAIYFGIRAYEAHGNVVRATLADRDNIDADDKIQILLDTFNDRRRALLFAVNPFGAQEDGVRSEGLAGAAGGQNAGFRFDGVVDLNPDYVYQSQGRVTPSGYEVEVRIPFKSLRYQSGATQDWGIQFIRTTQHSGYEDTWTPVVRASASFLIQSGTLKSLTGLRRGLVTVNQRFALFFPEKRPFFLEGLEQFDTPNALIYTRRIIDPVAGAKLTGKVGPLAVAYIGAVDDNGGVAGAPHPLVNLLRLRRDLGANSTIGMAYTDRSVGSAWNRVLGTDVRFIWKKIWFSDAQIVGSWTKDAPGSGVRSGALWDVTLYDRTGYSYGNHAELVGISPNFAALSGFVNRVNIVQGRFANRFTWYGKPGATLENATTFILIHPTWRYRDFFDFGSTLEGGINDQWLFTLRGGWGLSAHWQNNHQRFDPPDYANYQVDSSGTPIPFAVPHGRYNLWGGDIGFNTPNRALTFNGDVGAGKGVIFSEAAESRGLNAFVGITWKPTSALRVDGQWVHQRLTRAQDGSWFSTANIPRVKIEYQLRRDIFFRYVGQYTAQEVDALRDPRNGDPLLINGTTQPRRTDTEFRNDLLFSYRPIPGTVLFFGYGTSLTEPEPFNFGRLTRTGDGFFLKASYLFRM